MMSNKIVVALDHSVGSKQVFEQALSVAQANEATLILLHVLSIEEQDSPPMSPYLLQHKDRCIHLNPQIMRRANAVYDREWAEFTEKGLEILRSYQQQAIAAGVSAEFSQVKGNPATTICEFARSSQADLIIIGRRGHSGWKEMFLGSVSNYVVHHAPCSLLVVQTPVTTTALNPQAGTTQAII